jgi:hypothetical protein
MNDFTDIRIKATLAVVTSVFSEQTVNYAHKKFMELTHR